MDIYKDYPCHAGNYKKGRTQRISYLVIHYVGALGGAKANASYYGNTPGLGASAHYFVGHASEGAAVWSSVPEADIAWHCGRSDGKYKHPECRNANSIGIELCCHQDTAGKWYFDPSTVDRGIELAREIMGRYGIQADHVLRHFDVTGKLCPRPFVDDPKAWKSFLKRLEEMDLTKDQVQAMISAAQPRVYTSLEGVPLWAQGLVGRAMAAGIVRGDDTGALSITDQDLKTLSMLDRGGVIREGEPWKRM